MNSNEAIRQYEWTKKSILGHEVSLINELAEIISDYERKEDLLISVAECCINAIEHGNKLETDREIVVTYSEFRTHFLIRIMDSGKGYLHTIEKPNIHRKIHELTPRGWGLYLIDHFSDQVHSGFDERNRFYIELTYLRS